MGFNSAFKGLNIQSGGVRNSERDVSQFERQETNI